SGENAADDTSPASVLNVRRGSVTTWPCVAARRVSTLAISSWEKRSWASFLAFAAWVFQCSKSRRSAFAAVGPSRAASSAACAVAARGHEPFAVGRELDRRHAADMPDRIGGAAARGGPPGPIGRVPEADLAVAAGGRQQPAIG